METLGIWAAALVTLAVFSFLYRENPFYRWAEYTMVALAAANGAVVTYHNYVKPTLMTDIVQKGSYSLIIPALLGLLIYTRYFRSMLWLSRIPIAYWVGYGAGYILAYYPATLLKQITSSFFQLNSINNVLLFVGVVATFVYFIFTWNRERYPILGYTASVGRWTMMIAFGTAFGSTVAFRFNLLLGRLQFLLQEWLRVVK
ncbi:MAG: hypothetical protein M1299_09810 [Firmicutes bacterium]|nr:hypothetical protein [Bacillota bacterium]MCL5040100.1 hypothetical protein [Bacillota bacterium]